LPRRYEDLSFVEKCFHDKQAKEAEAWKYANAGQYWSAYRTLSPCIDAIKDPAYQALAQAFESQDYIETLKNPKARAKDKAVAYERLSELSPEKAAPFKSKAAGYQKALEAEEKAAARQAAAERRKQGVSIGMTKQDVLASSWGKPERINATHTSRGTREQWVYGSGSYLYFEDDVLTTVQTGR
jgi:hypothetical protein